MILEEDQLSLLPSRFAMVDGCFDPIHRGHVEYFRLARDLGYPLLCNVAADSYIAASKGRPALIPAVDRAAVIDALRYIDYVFITRHGTAWSLNNLRPVVYVKGADWKGRLPADQVALCDRLGIRIAFVDCPLNSSTKLVQAFMEAQSVYSRV